ncbi:chemotaxis protein CheW [Chromobacterium paludis]|uniref:Chemotaxis protein CheW n=1 Tax=Chromobacterium paludis TaxID=2605945 RepID=A0A5C1DC40_9NEIS|nr:chemotaxis protein CheW [Chromobacterium paludis]QEL54212.1 purine-binding chemotaxis protein CheW [Chromobacterium paludis]
MAALNILRRSEGAPATDETGETLQYLTFQLSGETFAIGILRIREILEYIKPTTVPLMPAFIRGVINLRGAVVPVIDLSLRFAREETAINRRTCVVIIEMEHAQQSQLIGVLVDAVHEVLAIPDSEIEPPPQFGSKIRVDFIEGMAKVDGHFVVLLNVDKVLSLEEMSLLSELGRLEKMEEEG